MRELVLALFSLSLSGSLMALVLFALKPLIRRHMSKSWQYYIWILVLVRLLLPIGPHNSLMQLAGERMGNPMLLSDAPAMEDDWINAVVAEIDPGDEAVWVPGEGALPNAESLPEPTGRNNPPFALSAVELMGAIWLGVAVVLLVRKLFSYNKLIREIKQSATPCEDAVLLRTIPLLCRELQIPLQPVVYINNFVPSPMLAGVFRPFIVIPAECVSHSDLRFVLRHELVHFKRRDIIYKWAAQITVCVHWVNPLVYLVQREIGHCCELACDEAVIRGMEERDKSGYGEAILSAVKPAGTKAYAVVSLSMSEDKRQLKERLIAIMGYKKKSRWVAGLAAMLTVVLLCGATYAGVYTKPQHQAVGGVGSAAEVQATAPGDLGRITIKGDTWYLIDTEEQLRGLGRGDYPLDGKYLLNADITLDKTVDWIPIGTQEMPFTGTFNGNGHEIVDLTIADTSVNIIGMFAYAEDADIYNVTLRAPDIERAFAPGNSIGPVLVIGKNCRSFDNHILDPVEKDSSLAVSHTSSGTRYVGRIESLIQDFAPYGAHGVIYNPDSDTVSYNGERVKLFAVFKPSTVLDTTYAFDLLYQDMDADSNLYLEAVRNSSGTVQEIRLLDAAIADELLIDLEGEHANRKGNASKPDSGEFGPYNFDATFNWLDRGISATDKFSRDDLNSTVTSWLDKCDRQQGAFTLKTESAGTYTTYIYYNGGGRYPWEMKIEGGAPVIYMYSDSSLVTSDGYFLMCFTAPQNFGTIRLFLDGTELELIS